MVRDGGQRPCGATHTSPPARPPPPPALIPLPPPPSQERVHRGPRRGSFPGGFFLEPLRCDGLGADRGGGPGIPSCVSPVQPPPWGLGLQAGLPGLCPPPGVFPGLLLSARWVGWAGPGDLSGGALTFPHGPEVQCTRAASVFNRPPSATRSRSPWPEVSEVTR